MRTLYLSLGSLALVSASAAWWGCASDGASPESFSTATEGTTGACSTTAGPARLFGQSEGAFNPANGNLQHSMADGLLISNSTMKPAFAAAGAAWSLAIGDDEATSLGNNGFGEMFAIQFADGRYVQYAPTATGAPAVSADPGSSMFVQRVGSTLVYRDLEGTGPQTIYQAVTYQAYVPPSLVLVDAGSDAGDAGDGAAKAACLAFLAAGAGTPDGGDSGPLPACVGTVTTSTRYLVAKVVNADGSTLNVQRNSMGRPGAFVDEYGVTTTLGWNTFGSLSNITYPDGTVVSLGYGLLDGVLEPVIEVIPDASGSITIARSYQALSSGMHAVSQVDVPGSDTARFSYNDNVAGVLTGALKSSTINGSQFGTDYDYQNGNRTVLTSKVGGVVNGSHTLNMDVSCRITSQTDALGEVLATDRNAAGLVTRVSIARTGEYANLNYDDAGHLVSASDDRGGATSISYQTLAAKGFVTDAGVDSGTVALPASIQSVMNGTVLANVTATAWDSKNRVTAATDNLVGKNWTFAYDSSGIMSVVTYDGITIAKQIVTRNAAGAVTQVTAVGATGPAVTIAYDANGNPVSQTTDSPVSEAATMQWAQNLLTTMTATRNGYARTTTVNARNPDKSPSDVSVSNVGRVVVGTVLSGSTTTTTTTVTPTGAPQPTIVVDVDNTSGSSETVGNEATGATAIPAPSP